MEYGSTDNLIKKKLFQNEKWRGRIRGKTKVMYKNINKGKGSV